MLKKSTAAFLLGMLAVGCHGQCQHENPIWRNDHYHSRQGWGIQPLWKDSHFDETFSVFDDSCIYCQPHHHIFSVLEDPYDRPVQIDQLARGHTENEGLPCQCHKQRQMREEQERMQKVKHRIAMLDREEEDLVKERQLKSNEFQLQEEEFQRRQDQISQLRAEASKDNTEVVGRFSRTDSQNRQIRQTAEKQRLPNEHRQAELKEMQARLQQQQKQQAEWRQQQQRQAELDAEQARIIESQKRQAILEEKIRQEAIRKDQIQQAAQHEKKRRNTVELARHQVTGYDPDDITINVTDGRVKIEGKHICHCGENCITREFVRSYPLPAGLNSQTITATMDRHGTIKILGEPNIGRGTSSSNALVSVEGLDIPQSSKPSDDELRKCLSKKGGIKLSKMNKNTGRIHLDDYKYDHEVLESSGHIREEITYDTDEGFIETVDY